MQQVRIIELQAHKGDGMLGGVIVFLGALAFLVNAFFALRNHYEAKGWNDAMDWVENNHKARETRGDSVSEQ